MFKFQISGCDIAGDEYCDDATNDGSNDATDNPGTAGTGLNPPGKTSDSLLSLAALGLARGCRFKGSSLI